MEGQRGQGKEVRIADGDGDGRVNVLAFALGHGELRPTTQAAPLCFAQRALCLVVVYTGCPANPIDSFSSQINSLSFLNQLLFFFLYFALNY